MNKLLADLQLFSILEKRVITQLPELTWPSQVLDLLCKKTEDQAKYYFVKLGKCAIKQGQSPLYICPVGREKEDEEQKK